MILVILILLLLISCSDSEKFDIEKGRQIQEIEIAYEEDGARLHLYGLWLENGKYVSFINSKFLYDYFWVINGDTVYSISPSREVGYGLHFVKLTLVDAFGDTISVSDSIYMPEPFKVILLSPIDSLELPYPPGPVFQYKVNRKMANSYVYASADSSSLWEEENIVKPLAKFTENMYFWGVKAFTEQDTVISEIRHLWLLKN